MSRAAPAAPPKTGPDADDIKKRSTLVLTLLVGSVLPMGIIQMMFCLLIHYNLTPLTAPKPYVPAPPADGQLFTANYDGIWHKCGPGVMWTLFGISIAIELFLAALWRMMQKKDEDGDPDVEGWKAEKSGIIAGVLAFLEFLFLIASVFGYVHLVVD